MAQITYENKVKINDNLSILDINKVTDADMNEIKDVVNENYDEANEKYAEINEKILNIGKLLWSGSFETGNIIVPDISKYTLIAINVNGVLCLGNQNYGGCVFTRYGNFDTTSYGYRYTYDSINETLTVDSLNTGATDGTNRQTITKIYGIF